MLIRWWGRKSQNDVTTAQAELDYILCNNITDIQLTDNVFYVYLHIRKSDGLVFYVGKGKDMRAWNHRGRSDWWKNTKKTHGIEVEIYKDSMPETCAFTLEKVLIEKYRYLNHPLVNMTDGGEGCSGRKMRQSTLDAINENRYIPIYCSNGMSFSGVSLAVDWLKSNGIKRASTSMLCRVCDDESRTSYGYAWSKIRTPDHPKRVGVEAKSHAAKVSRSVRIRCSNGMCFESLTDAVTWLKSEGKEKAGTGNISKAASGIIKTAYGYRWSY